MEKLFSVLTLAVQNKASDIHFLVGNLPLLRVNGKLFPLANTSPVTKDESLLIAKVILGEERYAKFIKQRERDCSYVFQDQARFRVNLYFQRDTVGIAMRLIPPQVPRFDALNLPQTLKKLTKERQGFVLVTGPTGHGKSTTLAAMLEEINQTRAEHIVSVEDPIEYFFKNQKSIFSQREIGSDTLTWRKALRSVLREDPNVVLIGEMRDLETIQAALTVAETGHLSPNFFQPLLVIEIIEDAIGVKAFVSLGHGRLLRRHPGVQRAPDFSQIIQRIHRAQSPARYADQSHDLAAEFIKAHQVQGVFQHAAETAMVIGRAQNDALGGGNFLLQPHGVRISGCLIMFAIAKRQIILP